MTRWLTLAAVILAAGPVTAGEITGKYIEARTCEVFTGPCFANADTGLTGKHGVMAWVIDKGAVNDVSLDGLGVVAVVAASNTLGHKQVGLSKAVLIVDEQANQSQREALIRLVKAQAGGLVDNVVKIHYAPVDLTICPCAQSSCAKLTAGPACIETKCIDPIHHKTCGNEGALYPPLAKNVKAHPACSVQHAFSGKGLNETWKDGERRGAYLGTFSVR